MRRCRVHTESVVTLDHSMRADISPRRLKQVSFDISKQIAKWWFKVFNMCLSIISRLFLVSILTALWIVKWNLCPSYKAIGRWKVTGQPQSFQWEQKLERERARRRGKKSLLTCEELTPEKLSNLPEVSQEPSGRLNPDLLRPKAKSSLQDYVDFQEWGEG